MNEITVKNWIERANGDLKIGKDEFKETDPVTEAISFHMQQCVEKYLKSFLIFHNKKIRKTHDITELINECSDIENDFNSLYDFDVDRLTEYAVETKYPGYSVIPSNEETQTAIKVAEKVKKFVLNKLIKCGFKYE